MPLNADTLERQLEAARQERSTVESQFAGKELKKQPKWRNINAKVTNLETRLEKAQNRGGAPVAEADSNSGEEE